MHQLEHLGVDLLELLFFMGWAGSVIVLLLSAVDDLATITGKHEPRPR